MKYFVPNGIVLTIVVAIMATYLKKKYPTKKVYMLPGGILTVISLIIAVISFLTVGGWNAFGYSILFTFVAEASIIGTVIGMIIGKRLENHSEFSRYK